MSQLEILEEKRAWGAIDPVEAADIEMMINTEGQDISWDAYNAISIEDGLL